MKVSGITMADGSRSSESRAPQRGDQNQAKPDRTAEAPSVPTDSPRNSNACESAELSERARKARPRAPATATHDLAPVARQKETPKRIGNKRRAPTTPSDFSWRINPSAGSVWRLVSMDSQRWGARRDVQQIHSTRRSTRTSGEPAPHGNLPSRLPAQLCPGIEADSATPCKL